MVWCQSDRLRSDGFPTTYHHDHHDYHHDHDIVMKSDYGLEFFVRGIYICFWKIARVDYAFS